MPHRVVVFGDVIDDVLVIPEGPIRPDTDTPAATRNRPGGSAANVAAWLGSLGTPVDFVGLVGRDDAVRHSAALAAFGVEPHLRAHPELSTGSIVVLVEGEGRSMLTDRGANAALDPDAVTDAMLEAADLLHLTGYSLFHSGREDAFRRLIARAKERGVAVSVDPASAGFLLDYGPARFLDAITGADLLFPNLDEGTALTGLADPERIGRALSERVGLVALTLGPAGVLMAQQGQPVGVVPAVETRTVDPTGAGDAFCAGFIHAWLAGADPIGAAEAGVRLAATALAVIGGRPPN